MTVKPRFLLICARRDSERIIRDALGLDEQWLVQGVTAPLLGYGPFDRIVIMPDIDKLDHRRTGAYLADQVRHKLAPAGRWIVL